MITVSAAGDGMVVFGYGESPSPWRPLGWPSELDPPLECFNRVGMVNLSNPRRPIVGAPVLLPGKLFAVTDISRSGFLAFTESVSTESTLADKDPRSGAAVYSTPAEPTRQVQASLVADSQASMFASVAVGLDAKLTAQGRNLYCATANRIDRFTLSDEASFTNTGSATTNWTPGEIQMRGISLVGAYGNQLMRVSWPGLDGVVENFRASQGFDLTRLTLSLDGSLLLPMGDYGVEKLTPVSASLMTLSAPNWALRRPIPRDLITIPQIRVSELRSVNVSSPEILKVTLSPAMLNLSVVPVSGVLTLNGTNSYTGGTYLASGSLVVSGSAPLSLTKMSGGSLALAGAQTLTGWTTISAGTVALSGTLNSTALTLASGGAITVSASNRLILTGTNAISYVTAGLVNTELVNSTLGTYPPVSLSSGIGTLSISSGITTSGGTLVLVGSSAGTGN